MKQSLLVAALIALAVSACGKKEEPAPVVEAPVEASAPVEMSAPAADASAPAAEVSAPVDASAAAGK